MMISTRTLHSFDWEDVVHSKIHCDLLCCRTLWKKDRVNVAWKLLALSEPLQALCGYTRRYAPCHVSATHLSAMHLSLCTVACKHHALPQALGAPCSCTDARRLYSALCTRHNVCTYTGAMRLYSAMFWLGAVRHPSATACAVT